MGKKWWLVHARTITKHGLKYRNKSYNESIYMETKYIFAKESSLATCLIQSYGICILSKFQMK
jgi:hypothetical protein